MKVLWLLPESPYPPVSGPHHHTYGLLQSVAQQHECDIIGFYRDKGELERWRQLQQSLPNVRIRNVFRAARKLHRPFYAILSLIQREPLVLRYYKSLAFSAYLGNLIKIQNYDLVHFDQFKVGHYWAYVSDTPRILVPYDAFSLGYYRAFKLRKYLAKKLSAFYLYFAFSQLEKNLYPHFTIVCPTSRIDAEWLKTRIPSANIEVLEIPVAEEFFVRATPGISTSQEPHLICMGWFSAEEVAEGAIEFLRHSLPLIKQVVPDLKVTIWGKNPIPALRSLIAQTPDVRLVEWVEDFISTLKSAWVVVFPQACGSGIQTKVQQALALGIPVVARRETLEPLYVQSGKQAFIFNTPSEMAKGVIALLTDATLRQQIGEAATEHMRQYFSQEVISRKLMRLYEQAVKS
jgi:glycosyltransferase involved in cell wall biosynthesis